MSDTEKDLKNKIEELQETNINLRFDSVEKELKDIKELLAESIKTSQEANKLLQNEMKETKDRIIILEEKNRNCPIGTYRLELKRISNETKISRILFKNIWTTLITLLISNLISLILLAAAGLEPIIKLITLFK